MKIEHLALHVQDPVAFAAWYGTHLGLRVLRHVPERNQTHFLGDDHATVIEVYHAPGIPVPDYRAQDPLVLHLAFLSADPEADAHRLMAAGAVLVDIVRPPDGSLLMMLRDPWGIAVQLCRRTTALR
jgi:glyoxylase I family protein